MATKRRRTRAATTTTRQSTGRSTWVVFLAGLIVGALAAVLVQNADLPERVAALMRADRVTGGDSGAPAARTDDTQNSTRNDKPQFKFYTMLPEMEVAVPEDELKESAKKKPAPAAPPARKNEQTSAAKTTEAAPPPGSRYVLQVGSFSNSGDAERLKANLALLGVQVHIQTVQINGADTWHRVRAGPFDSLESVNAARGSLRDNNFESMVLKVQR